MKASKGLTFAYLSLVFFNSFVDLGHKILIQNLFYMTESPAEFTIFSAIVNAMILIPYLLMFSPSGFIADKFAKSSVLKITAWAALPLTILITLFYYQGLFWAAFIMTLLLATQSALNSPAKYGYVKEYFSPEKLAKANGYVQALTVAAILLGTFLFSLFFQKLLGASSFNTGADKSQMMKAIAPLGFLLILSSLFESIMSLFLPKFKAVSKDSCFKLKTYFTGGYVRENLKDIFHNKTVLYCILGLSIFWGINQVVLACYGAYLKDHVLGATPLYVQGAMGIAVIGVILGSLYFGKISKQFIEVGTVPIAVAATAISLWLMVSITNKTEILILFLVYGFFSGLLLVPLNSLIQFHAPENKLGKILAANNFLQTLFMFGFLMLTVILTLLDIDAVWVFRLLFAFSLIIGVITIKMLPQSMIRFILYFFVSKFYRLKVHGLNNLPANGGVLLLGNHTSYLDWAAIQLASPRPVRFVMDRRIYNNWLLKWLFKAIGMIPISRGGSKGSIHAIEGALKNGDVVCLFPEGHLSRNGQLGQFFKGYELAIQNIQDQVVIVPFYLHGLWGSSLSLATKRFKSISKDLGQLRQIIMVFGEKLPATTHPAELKEKVITLSEVAWRLYAESFSSITQAWLYRSKSQGFNVSMIDAKSDMRFSGYRSIGAVWGLSAILKKLFKNQAEINQNIGLLLPSTVAGVLANLAVLSLGKTVVNLNYTASEQAFLFMLNKAGISTIITSSLFLTKLRAKGIPMDDWLKGRVVICLEDLRDQVSLGSKISKLLMAVCLPAFCLKYFLCRPSAFDLNKPAVILFSSGSEGLPKGVMLSHQNILANAKQSACVLNLQSEDRVLGSLPLFHAFGLTVTALMPLLMGTPVIFYPDPTDAKGVAKTVATYEATVLCGTSTFLNLYARHPKVHGLMFNSLRLVISGAEKLSEAVRAIFKDKFNLEIYQGYGATETCPVVSFNLPDILVKEDWHIQTSHQPGSVGLPVPGTSLLIVDPVSFEILPLGQEGLLLISGPQVMMGYLEDLERTQKALIQKNNETWYVTGDKAKLDDNGFLTIVDRYSRFAKVAGEMVSLSAVESSLQKSIPSLDCVAMAVSDEKKGEQIVLLVAEQADVSSDILRNLIQQVDMPALWKPKEILFISAIPKLGSGKTDYGTVKKLIA